MKRLVLITFILSTLAGCAAGDNKFNNKQYVIASEANVYEKTSTLSNVLKTVKYGETVPGLDEKYRFGVPEGWLKIKLSKNDFGYIETKYLADKDKVKRMDEIIKKADSKQVQASGITSKKTPIRMAPGRKTELIEVLRKSHNMEVLDKAITTSQQKGKTRKETWYLIKLDDGRAGYVLAYNINVKPPPELNFYTQSRKTVAWQLLREKEDKESGFSGKDYVVAFAGTALSPGTDFDRIELYNFDAKTGQYSTSLARSGLKGMLPLTVEDKGDGKIIQLRQLAKGKPGKLAVQEYSYPQPIKVVKEYEEDIEIEKE